MFWKFIKKIVLVLTLFACYSGYSFSQNFSKTKNSYVGVEFAALKRDVIQAYINAGFNFSGEPQADQQSTLLAFSFPIAGEKKEGVLYQVYFYTSLTSSGLCMPCEMIESYDPYQKLPSLGVSGIPDRLTLESRFSTARIRAFELIKASTTRYLKSGTDFVVPPKPATLGTPGIVSPPPMPVT